MLCNLPALEGCFGRWGQTRKRDCQHDKGIRQAVPLLRWHRDATPRERGGVFVYVLSPSKAAHLPEHFLGRVSCPSSQAARAQLVPQYIGALRDAGIHVLDAATLIHGLKGHYEVDLFPQGGVHWNDLGGALAVSALVKEINALAGRELVPPFSYTYTLSKMNTTSPVSDALFTFDSKQYPGVEVVDLR